MDQNYQGTPLMVKQSKLTPSVLNQVQQFTKKVKQAKIPISQVIVFGSHAKGTAHEWSDIDVCIVSPQFTNNHWDPMMSLTRLIDAQTIDIEAHPMHPDDLNNKYDTLATEVRKYGIVI